MSVLLQELGLETHVTPNNHLLCCYENHKYTVLLAPTQPKKKAYQNSWWTIYTINTKINYISSRIQSEGISNAAHKAKQEVIKLEKLEKRK